MTLQKKLSRQADITETAIDALALLHVRTVDTLAGYQKMVEKAEPAFLPVAAAFHDLHLRHEAALSGMLLARGRAPDADGSFMGTVNSVMVGLRSMFDDINTEVLGAIHSGEAYVLSAFDGALAQFSGADEQTALMEMRGELTKLLATHPTPQ